MIHMGLQGDGHLPLRAKTLGIPTGEHRDCEQRGGIAPGLSCSFCSSCSFSAFTSVAITRAPSLTHFCMEQLSHLVQLAWLNFARANQVSRPPCSPMLRPFQYPGPLQLRKLFSYQPATMRCHSPLSIDRHVENDKPRPLLLQTLTYGKCGSRNE